MRDQFINSIDNLANKPTAIAGVATGGIAIGALVAEKLNLLLLCPFLC